MCSLGNPPCLGLGFSHALQCVCFLDTASSAHALVSVTLAWCAASATPLASVLVSVTHCNVCASLTQRAPRSPWYQSHSPGVQPRQPPCLGLGFSHALQCVCFLDTASSAHALVSVTLAWCAASATPCLGLGFSHALRCVCFLDTASSALALVSVTLAWCAASATPLASVLVSVTHCSVCASLTQRAPRSPWYQSHSPGVQPRQPPLPRSWFQSRTAMCVLP